MNHRYMSLFVAMLCALLVEISADARVIHVTPNGAGTRDGFSWEDACATVTAGLVAAASGDEIWVKRGRYKEAITMKEGVELYGGFTGDEESREDRDWAANETIMDATGLDTHAVIAADFARLDGFTVTGGKERNGGGIYCGSGSPVFANCTIRDNVANEGGGLYCGNNSSPTLIECIIAGNSARGGDFHFWGGGGAHCGRFSSATFSKCLITNNSAEYNGGGVYGGESSASLTNCEIWDNHAGQYGGGLYSSYDDRLTLTNCTFMSNSATYEGGGISCFESSPSLSNCTIWGNSAGLFGGGVDLDDGSNTKMSNCIITDNGAGRYGGGLLCYESSPVLSNCIIFGNSAGEEGGGLFSFDSYPVVTNSILWGNSSEIYAESGSLRIAYSNVSGGFDNVGNIDEWPLFVDAESGDFRLMRNSPCIDAGNPGPEFNDGCRPPGQGGSRNDMGVYGGSDNCNRMWEYFNNTESIVQPSELALNVLTPGIVTQAEPAGYVVWATGCQSLLITIENKTGGEFVDLYARRGRMPTRVRYDHVSPGYSSSSHNELAIPEPGDEPWYFLIWGDHVPDGSLEYTIAASCVDLHLSSITPNAAANTGLAACAIEGAGFSGEMEVLLNGESLSDIPATTLVVVDHSQLDVSFDLKGVIPGHYDVEIRRLSDGASATLRDAFFVTEGSIGPRLEASLNAPDTVRIGRRYVLWLDYSNMGDADMIAPLFIVSSSSETTMSLSEDGPFTGADIWILGIGTTGATSVLSPGDANAIPIYFVASASIEFELSVVGGLDSPLGWNISGWDTWSDYQQSLANAATRLGRRGTRIYDVHVLEEFELARISGRPMGAITGRVRSGLTTMPLSDVYVCAVESEGHGFARHSSDEFGRYIAANIPSGTYEMSAEDRYMAKPVQVFLPEGGDLNGVDLFVLEERPTSTPRPPTQTPTATPTFEAVPSLGDMRIVINEVRPWSESTGVGEPLPYMIEIFNASDEVRDLTGWKIGGALPGEVISLPAWKMPPVSYLVVHSGTGEQDSDFSDDVASFYAGETIWTLTRESGELGLYSDYPKATALVDFVAWGNRQQPFGTEYRHAASSGQWFEDDFVDTSSYALFSHIGRIPSGYDRNTSADWQEIERTFSPSASHHNAVQISPQNGVLLKSLDTLEWRLIDGASGYYLEVSDSPDFLSRAISISVTDTTYSLSIPDGSYYWRVTPELPLGPYPITVHEFAIFDGLLDPEDAKSTGLIVRKQGNNPVVLSYVPHRLQQKDTSLLCLAQGVQDVNNTAAIPEVPGCSPTLWNKPHVNNVHSHISSATYSHITYCTHCNEYCTRAAIQMLNHKFGGSMTQDEISYWMFYNDREGPEGDLGHKLGTNVYDAQKGILFALNLAESELEIATSSSPQPPPWSLVTTSLDQDLPVMISQDTDGDGKSNHSTIISGYQVFQGTERVFLTDPWPNDPKRPQDGPSGWKLHSLVLADEIYLLNPQTPITARKGDSRVAPDSDTDGVFDFDEIFRFGTDWQDSATDKDTDGDLVKDLQEIRSYTFHAKRTPTDLTFHSKDNDSLRPELDPDSDGDGDPDGCEDINGDGVFEKDKGETDPFENSDRGVGIRVEDKEYSPGDKVYLVQSHDATMHADVTYQCEIAAGPIHAVSGAMLNNNVSFKTGKDGKPKRELGYTCPPDASGEYHLTVDILNSGKFWMPETNSPEIWQATWECVTKTPTPTGRPTPSPTSTQLDRRDFDVVGSYDPNEKTGPIGSGTPEHFVPVTDEFEYTIYFENRQGASAAAQEVFITDMLPEELDWTTFELRSYSFAEEVIAIPERSASNCTCLTVGLWVHSDGVWLVSGEAILEIEASLDSKTGMARWRFTTLDFETEDYPEDPFSGFLPPECATSDACYGRGQGYVTFTVRPLPDLPAGTEIRNFASIVFDYNTPIQTNVWLNTISEASPYPPTAPYPPDGAIGVSPFTILSWSRAVGASSYDLYLWREPTPKPGEATVLGIVNNYYQPQENFDFHADYNWQVISRNNAGETCGDRWEFRTSDENLDTPTPTSGDVNGDGNVDSLDLFVFSKNWHLCAVEIQKGCDINADEVIDEKDFLRLLAEWK